MNQCSKITKPRGNISFKSRLPTPDNLRLCASRFGLRVAEEIHKLKKRNEFSFELEVEISVHCNLTEFHSHHNE